MTLRVTLEIVPHGDESQKYVIRQLDIFNNGYVEGTGVAGGVYDYGVIEINPEANSGGLYKDSVYHIRDNGPWELVETVLAELVNK